MFAFQQSLNNGAAGDSENVCENARDLDIGVFQRFLNSILLGGTGFRGATGEPATGCPSNPFCALS